MTTDDLSARIDRAKTGLSVLLLKRGISCEALAEATGYSAAAIRSWRCGARSPSVGARALLASSINRLSGAKQGKAGFLYPADMDRLLQGVGK